MQIKTTTLTAATKPITTIVCPIPRTPQDKDQITKKTTITRLGVIRTILACGCLKVII